jgi:hypothetical protein
MPSYPEKASWLTREEKELSARRLGAHRSAGYVIHSNAKDTANILSISSDKLSWEDAKATLTDLRMYMHYLTYLTVGTGVASLGYFAPTIIEGLGYSDLRAQLFTVPPYGIAYPITLLLAWLSDRLKTRGLIATCSAGAACVAFIIQGKLALPRYYHNHSK